MAGQAKRLTSARHKIRIGIVDDENVDRRGLQAIVGDAPDMEVVLACESAQAFVSADVEVDVVLSDLYPGDPLTGASPDLKGVALLTKLAPVLVVSMSAKDEDVYDVVENLSVAGYLNKKASDAELLGAIRQVAHDSDHVYLGTALAGVLLREIKRRKDLPKLPDVLHDTLQLLADGLSDQQIGEVLGRSRSTVSSDLKELRQLLGWKGQTRVAIVRNAEEAGLIRTTPRMFRRGPVR